LIPAEALGVEVEGVGGRTPTRSTRAADGGWIGDDGWIGDRCGERGKQGERRKGGREGEGRAANEQ